MTKRNVVFKDKHGRIRSFQVNSIYAKPKYQYLADIVSLETPEKARNSVAELGDEFRSAKSKQKQLRVVRATQLAANRAKINSTNSRYSIAERKEFVEITTIYNNATKSMWKKYRVRK